MTAKRVESRLSNSTLRFEAPSYLGSMVYFYSFVRRFGVLRLVIIDPKTLNQFLAHREVFGLMTATSGLRAQPRQPTGTDHTRNPKATQSADTAGP